MITCDSVTGYLSCLIGIFTYSGTRCSPHNRSGWERPFGNHVATLKTSFPWLSRHSIGFISGIWGALSPLKEKSRQCLVDFGILDFNFYCYCMLYLGSAKVIGPIDTRFVTADTRKE